MKIVQTDFEGLIILEPTLYNDVRGYFYESFNKTFLEDKIENLNFVQENISSSKLNVLRGLHFQVPPHAQAKLVQVIQGKVLDVVVDLRKDSATYGKSFSIELSSENKLQMYVPRGFAHGFVSLKDDSIFSYKCDNLYHKESERTLAWDDPAFNIDWKVDSPILSAKDLNANLSWNGWESPF